LVVLIWIAISAYPVYATDTKKVRLRANSSIQAPLGRVFWRGTLRDLQMGVASRCPMYPYREYLEDGSDIVYVSYVGPLDCQSLRALIDTLVGVGGVERY